ncbi:RNA polymerase sigma factor [Arcticibacterium luteifluviistationis]|uniref:RNA polymerase subunit sigma-24 n=1 Tax=Arcticibacterium luteifluviistationis TaxID=1784714 RepID=A0A2Z4G858_9BACT|nr:RNA polymerase sigma factor [Arcticibacterium luteifluviistationis]AWV97285.1 RNA polymerase subunit sigma-24 [Arcticibacterium luteifluviistationis]
MKTNDFKNRVLSLSERIFPMVSRMLGNSTTAQDATQEIMIKLWDKRKQIESHPNLTGFVFMTARNYCLDILKRKGPQLVSSDLELNKLEAATGQETFEWNELTTIVEKILAQLPEQQRAIMTMRDIDGLEFPEIAAATQLKVEHVRVLLSRARKQVAASLKKTEDYGH